MEEKSFFTAKNVTILGVLTAIIVVLQIFGSYFRIGTISLSFVLVPIVIGGILTGVIGGTILGFIFGVITLVMGVVGADQFTFILFSDHPFLTILTCVIKGSAAGFMSGFVYKLLKDKNLTLSTFAASAVAPIVNTGLFIVGAFCMADTLNSNFVAENSNVVYFIFIGCAGINFLIELAINLVLAPSVCKIIKAVKR
ncbi:MAG: ECF transporter S component [Clostridia bacterium]|nr:ECF transporter S component [Clostridia bacterium]